jgi:hypothetical protein
MTDRKQTPRTGPAIDLPEENDLEAETPTPAQGGSSGGDLARKVGWRDEAKNVFETPAGKTRVEKHDEPETRERLRERR